LCGFGVGGTEDVEGNLYELSLEEEELLMAAGEVSGSASEGESATGVCGSASEEGVLSGLTLGETSYDKLKLKTTH
jgi:hypothetical protein